MQGHGNSYAAVAPIGWAFRQVRDQVGQLGARLVFVLCFRRVDWHPLIRARGCNSAQPLCCAR